MDDAAIAAAFLERVQGVLKKYWPLLLQRAYGDAATTLGIDIAFDLANPLVQRVLNELLQADSLQSIGDSLLETARGLVGRAAAEGWSTDELGRALRAAKLTDSVMRGQRIARTESAAAYSRGSVLAFQESGVVDGMEWLASDPCPICEPLEGKIVKLGQPFAPGIAHPPAHPNCRCAIAPVIK